MEDAITEGQRRRFERLMWPWIATVLRFARYLTKSEHAAEDLAQETMMRALRHIDRFEEGTDARAWLLTLERRLFLDRARVMKHRPMASLDGVREPAAPGEAAAGAFDEQWEEPEKLLQRFGDQEVIDALRELPDEMRWTLLLVDVEGLDHPHAAEVLDVAPGTIKSRTHRGRRMLRDLLFQRALARGWVTAEERGSA